MEPDISLGGKRGASRARLGSLPFIPNWCKSSLVSYFSSLSPVLLSMGKQITLLNRRITTEGLSLSSVWNQMHPDARPSWVFYFIVPVTGTKNESPAVTSTDDEVETGMTGQHKVHSQGLRGEKDAVSWFTQRLPFFLSRKRRERRTEWKETNKSRAETSSFPSLPLKLTSHKKTEKILSVPRRDRNHVFHMK